MNIENINPMQWLAINVANQYGHNGVDKLNHEDQIEWVKQNMGDLETFVGDEPAQYVKAVKALRDAQNGLPVSIPVGLDASCSGVQIMSALTNCRAGAYATNLLDPTEKKDGYTIGTDIYNHINGSSHKFRRDDVKIAIMAHYYGSKAIPREVFGEGENLDSFYLAMQELSPKSNELLQVLINSWNPNATHHEWLLPDGFHVKIPSEVTVKHELIHPEVGIPVHIYETVVAPKDRAVSNAANMVHGYDAYVLRTMERRLNYDRKELIRVNVLLGMFEANPTPVLNEDNKYMCWLYEQSKMVCIRDTSKLNLDNVGNMSDEHRAKLKALVGRLLSYPPFRLMTIHDDFRCLPIHVTRMAHEYREILAELSESNALNFSLGHLNTTIMINDPLGDEIRKSNYALS